MAPPARLPTDPPRKTWADVKAPPAKLTYADIVATMREPGAHPRENTKPVETIGDQPTKPVAKKGPPVGSPPTETNQKIAQRTPAKALTPTTNVVNKARWIYVSNVSLPGRRRGWQETTEGWRT
jgi:hypothetical protein